MIIKFTGYMTIAEPPDDMGSVDLWLLSELEHSLVTSLESDDVYEKFHLSWKEVETLPPAPAPCQAVLDILNERQLNSK